MIFVSVGMQMPFDRMCAAIDNWAGEHDRDDVFMQIGETRWKPEHCRYANMISPPEFRMYIEQYESDASKQNLDAQEALGPLIQVALDTSKLKEFTGRDSPSVIT